jgi:alanine racemase
MHSVDEACVPRYTAAVSSAAERAGAILSVDLAAIAANYRRLQIEAPTAICAAVVKADAYGLGAAKVAPTLAQAGCRQFFVAHLDEGIALRNELGSGLEIAILHGPMKGTEADFIAYGLTPVLNSMDQIHDWSRASRTSTKRLPAVLQVDTGMSRFGLGEAELAHLDADPQILAGLDLRLIMSHLACADEPGHQANVIQRKRFEVIRRRWPHVPASLAASSGIFLGHDYQLDHVRPGAALYGIAPQPGAPNPMRPVVHLEGKVVQVREVPAQTPVGYGHTARTETPSRLATVTVGYADGFLRSASNRGAAWIGQNRLPVVGRVSMDSIVVDATAVPGDLVCPGTRVDLIGPQHDLDAVAREAGTIGYEILTNLGSRYHRQYIGT